MVRGGGGRRRGEHEREQRAHRPQPPFCLRLLLVCGRSNPRATAGINLYPGYDEGTLGEGALRDVMSMAQTRRPPALHSPSWSTSMWATIKGAVASPPLARAHAISKRPPFVTLLRGKAQVSSPSDTRSKLWVHCQITSSSEEGW